ncbi:major capsid protein VP1 [Microviridae Fen7786_21]|uniref:major capsid protein VP1 n=1 Tax=Microviridae Fen7786_21 TaxID=1655658 RepID=UPI00063D5FF1|nr:major capsid protein VP1 [Microviridae Fen7786_21]AKI26931.1 major capsid protein VP1 [Microviridae Fen7786_21]
MAQRILDTGNPILMDRPINNVNRNTFSLSHNVKTSCEIGQLVPICTLEVMPGDTFHITTEALIRYQALISPVMHAQNARTEWFFVPYRLLWQNWENFISPPTGQVVPPAMPFFPTGSLGLPEGGPGTPNIIQVGSLDDYLGCVPGLQNPQICAFFHAAYQKIFTDWYMDEDLGDAAPVGQNTAPYLSDGENFSGPDFPYNWSVLQLRNYDRDYFTSAKPWTQKGPAVVIPITSSISAAPVDFDGNIQKGILTSGDPLLSTGANVRLNPDSSGASHGQVEFSNSSGTLEPGSFEIPAAQISADNFQQMMGTIEQLRQCEALQKFLEADSRGGTRYAEVLKQHFGVYSSDARLQRPEYLGGTNQPIVISEVLNTTGTDTAPQGQMAGHGISAAAHNQGIHYYAEEHGVIMGLMSVLPKTGYYQGYEKRFFRQSRLDFPWPEFAELGEQPILNQELFYTFSPTDSETFGYVPMYAEWRTKLNQVSGTFRTSLDFWHMDRKFTSLPSLSSDFIACSYPFNNLNRIFATLDETGHILAHWFHKISVERKLPRYVRPSI